MPNMLKVRTRALDIAAQRIARVRKDMQQQAQQANKAPQDEKRAAYEFIAQLTGNAYVQARAMFDQQYGPDEWRYQQGLGIVRTQKEEAGQ